MIVKASLALLGVALLGLSVSASHLPQVTRIESFDSDPGWTGSNTMAPGNNFGFSNTGNTTGNSGEAGGTFDRFNGTLFYADTDFFEALTVADSFAASGSFVFREDEIPFDYNQDVYVGFFNTGSIDSRLPSLGVKVIEGSGPLEDGESFRIEVEYRQPGFSRDSGQVHSKDGGIAAGAGFSPKHTFSFSYDPDGNGGLGSFDAVVNDGTTDIISRTAAGGNPVNLTGTQDFEFNAFGIYVRNRGVDVVAGARDWDYFTDDLTYTATEIPLPDFDGSGVVDELDLDILNGNLYETEVLGMPVEFADGDANFDGIVDHQDYRKWTLFSSVGAGSLSAPVPEPSTLLLGTLACIGLILRRRCLTS